MRSGLLRTAGQTKNRHSQDKSAYFFHFQSPSGVSCDVGTDLSVALRVVDPFAASPTVAVVLTLVKYGRPARRIGVSNRMISPQSSRKANLAIGKLWRIQGGTAPTLKEPGLQPNNGGSRQQRAGRMENEPQWQTTLPVPARTVRRWASAAFDQSLEHHGASDAPAEGCSYCPPSHLRAPVLGGNARFGAADRRRTPPRCRCGLIRVF